jgi:hypothetical protein
MDDRNTSINVVNAFTGVISSLNGRQAMFALPSLVVEHLAAAARTHPGAETLFPYLLDLTEFTWIVHS